MPKKKLWISNNFKSSDNGTDSADITACRPAEEKYEMVSMHLRNKSYWLEIAFTESKNMF